MLNSQKSEASLLPKLDNIIKVKKIPLMERNNYDAIQYLET